MNVLELPDDLLRRIFATESLPTRCALACTCKHLRQLTSGAGFWGCIELDAGRLQKKGSAGVAAMLHYLAKRMSKDTRLTLSCSTQPLDPYRTPVAACDWPHLSVVPLLMGVGINPGLAALALDLHSIGLAVQREILNMLPWLSTLRELEVTNIYAADLAQLNALSKLTRLERLSLRFSQPDGAMQQSFLSGFPEKLAQLRGLKYLRLQHAGFLGALPDVIGCLTGLEALDLGSGTVITGLPRSVSGLASLASARIEHCGANDLAALAWLPGLRRLHLTGNRMPVELASCQRLSALTLLLGNVPEHQLELGFSRMLGFSPQAEELRTALPQWAPWQLGKQLRVLHIADTKLGSVPQAVTLLPGLEHLSLTHCSLFDLPEGPYISKLQTLVLRQNFFIEVPHALRSGAAVLRDLDLSYNLLRPSEVDVETVLRLPALRNLWVTKTIPQPGPERFRQAFNSWTAYSMDCLFKLAARHAAQFPGRPLNVHLFQPRPLEL